MGGDLSISPGSARKMSSRFFAQCLIYWYEPMPIGPYIPFHWVVVYTKLHAGIRLYDLQMSEKIKIPFRFGASSFHFISPFCFEALKEQL